MHYSTHCENSDCSWSNWTCQAWQWQMASLLWVYRYIDIDIVYVHSTVYLWKNVKTLAIIKWLHHANRISFVKSLKHNMNLVERINLHLFGILHLFRKCYPCRSQDFILDYYWHPLLWVQKLKCVPFKKETKVEWRNKNTTVTWVLFITVDTLTLGFQNQDLKSVLNVLLPHGWFNFFSVPSPCVELKRSFGFLA